jgi:hypothetical protein
MKLYFVTFANTDFMNLDRIINQAKDFNMFDYCLGLTEKDIPEFIEKHKEFIDCYNHGYGLWIWKPKIILDTLNKMNENDILLYCDAGMWLNSNGKSRFKEYMTLLNNKSIITFSSSYKYIAQYFVKNDAIMSYYPEFNNEYNISQYAGIMIIKKNAESIQLINDWLHLCENYYFLDKFPSIQYPELSHFRGNDCDNGLFNLCLSKHKTIYTTIYPDETNLYTSDGIQIVHAIDKNNYHEIDWSQLDKMPFQCRRITPKNL